MALYYALKVSEEDFGIHTYRLPSQHPFVSPLETELYFSLLDLGLAKLDCFFAQVAHYQDHTVNHHRREAIPGSANNGDFYMILLKEGDGGLDGEIVVSSGDFAIFHRHLLNLGWEEIDEL
ncbi:MAG: hypothetical protein AAB883_00365 [Patescibacteria group bacterium]